MEELLSVGGNWRKRRVEHVSRLGEIDRRTFVKLSGASAAAFVFWAGPFTERAMAQARFPDYMKFVFASCQQYEHGYFTAYRHISEEDLDLVVHLGDYIYEYDPNQYVAPAGNVRAHSGAEIITLLDYRNRHPTRISRRRIRPSCDDHEVENNYADEIPGAGSQTPTTEAFLRCRSVPRGPDMLYRRIACGNLAEFNVLDTRQYRDDQAAGDGTDPPNPEQQDPARTLTGGAQEKWLLDGLSSSSTTWNVLVQQVFLAQRYFNTSDAERYSMDAWANNLKANFDDQSSRTLGVELVGTSITPGGDGADTTSGNEAIVDENPHIEFFNEQRGYVRCTLTPKEWRADYRVLAYVKRPGAQIYTLASFVTKAGNPGLQQAGEPQASSRSASLVEADTGQDGEHRDARGQEQGGDEHEHRRS
jgi:alkaline phosphatase D